MEYTQHQTIPNPLWVVAKWNIWKIPTLAKALNDQILNLPAS